MKPFQTHWKELLASKTGAQAIVYPRNSPHAKSSTINSPRWNHRRYWSGGIQGLAGSALLQGLCGDEAAAAWDLAHAVAVEDLLGDYIKTLPGGSDIQLPRLFIYQGKAFSRDCPNSGIDSPAYCPGDHTVYLETSLGNAVAARYGDFGALSIIAHEFGHAYLFKIERHPPRKDGELAADAFAGGFARYVKALGLLETGDLDEARSTFSAVGDYEVYHHDHHGTPMERRQAFNNGYLQGFRLPGDSQQAQPEHPNPQPRSTAPTPYPSAVPASPALPILGLGLGVLLIVMVVAAIVVMVNQARENDF